MTPYQFWQEELEEAALFDVEVLVDEGGSEKAGNHFESEDAALAQAAEK